MQEPIAAPAPAPTPGQTLGGYRIEGLIGRGASSSVYRAHDPRTGQAVALKVLRGMPAEAAGLAAFDRETRSVARLNHPGIADLLAAGREPGVAWLAMTLAPGQDLQARLQHGEPLPVAAVLEIGARVAAALAHAHRRGVVHRDVKPANIIVGWAGSEVRSVVLTDFGVARLAEAAGSAAVTRSGALLGTVAYMAPELLAGLPAQAASDLYALGATLFHLLTGHLPHDAATLAAQMQAITHQPAPDVRTRRGDLSGALAALLAQLLAKAPAERGQDAAAVAERLRALATPGAG